MSFEERYGDPRLESEELFAAAEKKIAALRKAGNSIGSQLAPEPRGGSEIIVKLPVRQDNKAVL